MASGSSLSVTSSPARVVAWLDVVLDIIVIDQPDVVGAQHRQFLGTP